MVLVYDSIHVAALSTLKVFRHGDPTDYVGPRKADGIISYMTKYVVPFTSLDFPAHFFLLHRQSLPAVSQVTAANIEEFKLADKIVAIAYLSSPSDSPAAEFQATAEKHRDDYLFGQSTDAAVIEAAGVSPPAIVLYRAFDDPISVYPSPVASATVEKIETWIKELSIPTIAEVTAENYMVYAQSGKPLAYLFVDPTAESKEYIEQVRAVAVEYKNKINFVWIDAIKFGDHAKSLNLAESVWPSFVIQDLGKQLKYPVEQHTEITTAVVKDWVDSFISGTLQPTLKSQPIPETQDQPVYDLVGKEFEQVALQDDKDVFVEFYASW